MASELDLIRRLAATLPIRPGVERGIGDDAAILTGDPPIVVTCDMLVEGVHFRREGREPADLGHKALAVNLSDLAAMAATPIAALVALGIPGGIPPAEIDAFYEGMDRLAARAGVTVAGGDTCAAPALTIAVTALGTAPAGLTPPGRDGARPGDLLCVTGALGGSAAGLLALEAPTGALTPTAARARCVARHLRPEPRIAEGPALARAGAHAMLDVSDGLGLDASRIAEASGCGARIELTDLPLDGGVAEIAGAFARDPHDLALAGGEDYELLVAIAPQDLPAARADLEVPLTPVGVITAEPGVRVVREGAPVTPASLGWIHAV